MEDQDEGLIAAIQSEANHAKKINPMTVDSLWLAERLRTDFPHRTIEEIREKIRDVWRKQGLFLTDR